MPRRASVPACQAARYGLRWHARDLARRARLMIEQETPLGMAGLPLLLTGAVMLIATLPAALTEPHAWAGTLASGTVSVAGAVLLTAAHWKRWHG